MANFSLTWNVAAGTYQQELYYKPKYSGSWNLLATLDGATTTYSLTGIPDNKIQQFKITAFCTDGFPKDSAVIEFASLTCPSVVTVTPACGGTVNYSFAQVGGDVNNYDIQLLSNADVVISTQTKAAAATVTGSFTGLTGVTPYKIKVISKADTITKACSSVSFTSKPDSPTVTTQPISQAACDDQTVTLTAVYSCVGCTYQWYKDNVALTNTGDYSNVTTQSLTIANAGSNIGSYKLKGTNECAAVDTNAVTVSLLPDTSVSVQPANNNVCVGGTATFGVTAGGGNVTYQWQISTDGGTTYTDITGATASTYSFTAASGDDGKKYRTKVNSTCGPEIISSAGTVAIVASVAISQQPNDQTVCDGANATFTVVASGTGLTYQWQRNNTVAWTNILNATSASYTVVANSTSITYTYRVVVTGTCGTETSSASSLSLASDTANWVQRDISQYYNCVGVNKHYQEIDTNPCSATYNTTRDGSLYESNSTDCGYVPCNSVTALSADFESNLN
jgi:hypothetical protein